MGFRSLILCCRMTVKAKFMERNSLIYWLGANLDAKITGADANGLYLDDKSLEELFKKSLIKKREYRGDEIYLRGLVEISNICCKNCLYCGIRRGNGNVTRYELTDDEILKEAKYAAEAGYGSVVLQGGERRDSIFIERICRLLQYYLNGAWSYPLIRGAGQGSICRMEKKWGNKVSS